MAKLKDLWADYKSLDRDDPRRIEIQKQINDIEMWCIQKKLPGFTSITKWNNDSFSDSYPHKSGAVRFEDMWQIAELNGKNINFNKDGTPYI